MRKVLRRELGKASLCFARVCFRACFRACFHVCFVGCFAMCFVGGFVGSGGLSGFSGSGSEGYLGRFLGVRSALAEQPQPLVLAELFTSQGCSSCPAADRYFSSLAEEKDLAILVWHVPYWDYIGWRDPFGLRVSERRQRRYARRLGEHQIYTPQAILGGKVHYVGSDKRAVGKGLRSLRGDVAKHSPRLSLRRVRGRDFSVSLSRGDDAKRGTRKGVKFDVMVVLYQASAATNVERGENRGRRLVDSNIVREVIPLGSWDGKDGESLSFSLPAAADGFDVVRDGGFVVVVEPHVVGEGTTGAARWDFKRGLAPKGS